MKKHTSSLKSPTPATKPAAAAKKAAAAPTAVSPAKAPKAKTASRIQEPSPTGARFEAAASALPALTVITAQIDVGFGNALYLRGEGAGLTWEQGTPMQNRANDLWTISLAGLGAPIRFKFLLNDSSWSAGDDYFAGPGTDTTHAPSF